MNDSQKSKNEEAKRSLMEYLELHRETLSMVSRFVDDLPIKTDSAGRVSIYERQRISGYLMVVIGVVLEKDRKEQADAGTIAAGGRGPLQELEDTADRIQPRD